jgi:hypothetical protein
VALVESQLPGRDGVAFLGQALPKNPKLYIRQMSADHWDEAIEAIAHCADDFLFQPLTNVPPHIDAPQTSRAAARESSGPLPPSALRGIDIRRVPETCQGNRVRAAGRLGIGAPASRASKLATSNPPPASWPEPADRQDSDQGSVPGWVRRVMQ